MICAHPTLQVNDAGICCDCGISVTPCPWQYPGWHGQRCGAPATLTVRYRATGEITAYCLNHAQAEVLGGQASYTAPESFGHAALTLLVALAGAGAWGLVGWLVGGP